MRRLILAACMAAVLLSAAPAFAAGGTDIIAPSMKLAEPTVNPLTQPNGRMDGNLFMWLAPHLMLGFRARSLGDIGPHIGIGTRRTHIPGIASFTWSFWLPLHLKEDNAPLLELKSATTGFIITF